MIQIMTCHLSNVMWNHQAASESCDNWYHVFSHCDMMPKVFISIRVLYINENDDDDDNLELFPHFDVMQFGIVEWWKKKTISTKRDKIVIQGKQATNDGKEGCALSSGCRQHHPRPHAYNRTWLLLETLFSWKGLLLLAWNPSLLEPTLPLVLLKYKQMKRKEEMCGEVSGRESDGDEKDLHPHPHVIPGDHLTVSIPDHPKYTFSPHSYLSLLTQISSKDDPVMYWSLLQPFYHFTSSWS